MQLSTKTVEGSALAFQSVDHVHGCDSLSLGVFAISDGIADDVFKEDLQNTAGLLVDQSRNTLDTTTTGQTTDGGFRDSLDVITEDFAMALGTSLSETFSTFAWKENIFSKLKVKSIYTCQSKKA